MIETASLAVSGMKCGGCETNVTTKLLAMEGIKSATASSKDKEVTVEFDPERTHIEAIKQAIADAGYSVVENN